MTKLESVNIIQYHKLVKKIRFIDWLHRYADLLAKHQMSPYKQMGLPLPIFVLREMAYKLKNYTSEKCPLTCIVDSFKDTAYVVSMASRKDKLINIPMVYDTTFKENELINIEKMVAKLHKEMTVHRQLITKLQKAQQDLWKERDNVARRTAAQLAYRQSYAYQDTDNMALRLRIHDEKVQRSRQAYRDANDKFQALARKEQNARTGLVKLQDELFGSVGTAVSITLIKTAQAIERAIDNADKNGNYDRLKSTFLCMSGYMIADELLKHCSKTYIFPDIQQIIKTRLFTQKFPGVSLLEPCDLVDCIDYESESSNENLVNTTESSTDDCGNNNDCYLRAVVKPGRKPDPCFLNVAPSDTLKQKLRLMDGDVVFGWARKGFLGIKSWGFCLSSTVTRIAK